MSTYLFVVCAGPYLTIDDDSGYRIPMTIYVRESLHKYLLGEVSSEVFELTSKSIDWYDEFFGYKFPYRKYDYVYCPEYNMGAMENPGCITVNDAYVYKGKRTVD